MNKIDFLVYQFYQLVVKYLFNKIAGKIFFRLFITICLLNNYFYTLSELLKKITETEFALLVFFGVGTLNIFVLLYLPQN
ncbi:hypothetical protein QUF82_02600 [Thiotrichales bacterium HSG14]|nr:hypothetical protein [Thiotrichales bacterium HSG14]